MSRFKDTTRSSALIAALDKPSLSVFDTMLTQLPNAYKDAITRADQALKAMRPLRFKRVVDRKAGKITYVASDYGISYLFRLSGDKLTHQFQWYIVTNGKPETWHRRADDMERTLSHIAKEDTPLANRIFNKLKICPGFDYYYGERCLARTPYAFDGQKRLTCHGSVVLGMNLDDFDDALSFFRHLNTLAEWMQTNEEPRMEKIILCQAKRFI